MNLQQAIDLIHDIREQFVHVETCLTTSRIDSNRYIVGASRDRNWHNSCTIAWLYEWIEFLRMHAVFFTR